MIELKNINKTYAGGEGGVQALQEISLKISQGEFVAIMGPSGSGKSTLMHVIGLLDRPDSGSYLIEGTEMARLSGDDMARLRNRLFGFVFQQFHLLPRMTAVENAAMPLVYAGKRHLKENASKKIDEVGLGTRARHRPNQMSGGEQQRVAIARSLVNEPAIILADEPTGNLDTKSEEEIMSVLTRLNGEGKTVVIVTHEKEIAEYAKRIILMRDGRIVSDEKKGRSSGGADSGAERIPIKDIICASCKSAGQAQLMDYLRQAASAIFLHKLRTFLSVLGILIGVAAVIAMLALGQGASDTISRQLSSLGSNLILVLPGSSRVHGVAMGTGTVTRFTFQDVDSVRRLTGKVNRAYGGVNGRGQLVYADKNWNTQLEGVGVEYPEMRNAIPAVGRFFTDEELRIRAKVAVIGATVARELFGDENPVNKSIKINLINFKVIGILPAKGASGWHDQDDNVVIPVTTAMYRVLGKDYLDNIFVEVVSPELIEETQEDIKKAIIKNHRLNKEGEDTFQIRNMAELKKTLEETTKTMGLLLGSIAAISLVVGGIGIMNIMLVSVTERTREIGLRKAIGARNVDIMVQFLIEAALIGFIGGITGVLLGSGVSSLIALVAGWAVKLSPFSIILATGFSLIVGIVFGIWPAHQASQLNPIEALRYE
jgi:macrolide transport system ATP-binding/permease protein